MSPGEYIKNLRMKKKWSLKTMAQKITVPINTYKGWEDGRKIPAEGLRKIAQVHGVSTTEILNLSEVRTESLTRVIYYLEEAIQLVKQAQS